MGNSYTKKAKKLVKQYDDRCMLTQKKDKLTYHHLVKKEHGGDSGLYNGAPLNSEVHQWLHNYVEQHCPELYDKINESMFLYKKALDRGNVHLVIEYESKVVPAVINFYNKTTRSKTKIGEQVNENKVKRK